MKHIQTGNIGEDIACRFLERKGYKIVERNFRKKFGELDIIAQNNGVLNFIEVKTLTGELGRDGEVLSEHSHRPEENVHAGKLKRIGRAIKAYITSHAVVSEWQFKVITVIYDSV